MSKSQGANNKHDKQAELLNTIVHVNKISNRNWKKKWLQMLAYRLSFLIVSRADHNFMLLGKHVWKLVLPELLRHCLISFGTHCPSRTLERSPMILVVLHGQSHEIPLSLSQLMVHSPRIQNASARMDRF